MHLLITGGTGLIGSALTARCRQQGHQVTILTRNLSRFDSNLGTGVDDLTRIANDAELDAIVNLAGAPIGQRWSQAYKRQLLASRIGVTEQLELLVSRLERKPRALVSASAIGYYGSHAERQLEEDSEPHDEFTHRLCRDWELAAQRLASQGLRVCLARLGVVLAPRGGALARMLPAFRLGLGGQLGDGEQYFSWIHLADALAALEWLLANEGCSGSYNLTAPLPVTNREFTAALAAALRRPALLPMPSIVVKMLFGEMGESLLLRGQRVIPSRLQQADFNFQYPDINSALANLLT